MFSFPFDDDMRRNALSCAREYTSDCCNLLVAFVPIVLQRWWAMNSVSASNRKLKPSLAQPCLPNLWKQRYYTCYLSSTPQIHTDELIEDDNNYWFLYTCGMRGMQLSLQVYRNLKRILPGWKFLMHMCTLCCVSRVHTTWQTIDCNRQPLFCSGCIFSYIIYIHFAPFPTRWSDANVAQSVFLVQRTICKLTKILSSHTHTYIQDRSVNRCN